MAVSVVSVLAGPAIGGWPGPPGVPTQLLVFFSEASRVR